MKLPLFTSILLFCCHLVLSQNDASFNEAFTSYNLYEIEGKSALKKQADSLLTIFLKLENQNNSSYEVATILKLSIGELSERKNKFDSIAESNSLTLNNEFNFYKNALSLLDSKNIESLLNTTIAKDSLAMENGDSKLKSLYFSLVMEVLYTSGNFDDGIAYGKRAIQLINTDNSFEPVHANRVIGGMYYRLGDRTLGVSYMEKAYDLAKDEDPVDSSLLTSLSWNLGVFSFQNSVYDKAEPYILESIKHYEIANGVSPYLISRYAILSDNYFYSYDYKKAEIAGLKAKSLAQDELKTDDVYLNGLVGSALSRIYAAQGKFDKARENLDPWLEKTIEAFGEDSSLSSAFTGDKARLEYNAGNIALAEKYYAQAINMANKTDRIYTKTAALSEMIVFLMKTNQHTKAKKFIRDEKELLVKNGDTTSMIYDANKYYTIVVLMKEGKLNEANKLQEERQVFLQTVKNQKDADISIIENIGLSLQLKNEKYKETKKLENVEDPYVETENYLNKIIAQKSSLEYDASKIFYGDFVAEQITPALDYIHTNLNEAPSNKGYSQALKFMEINKSSALLDGFKMETLSKTYNVDSNLMKSKDSLKNRMEDLTQELNNWEQLDTISRLSNTKLINEQLALQSQMDGLKEKLKIEYPKYYKSSTLSLSENIDYYKDDVLIENEVVLEYFLSDDYIYRLQVSSSNIVFDKIKSDQLSKDVMALFEALKSRKEYANLLNKISEKLLPDLPLDISRLTIIADDVLGRIPFEILIKNDKTLLETCPVRYAGSLQLLDEQIKNRKKLKTSWVGFAPQYKDAILSNNEVEVSAIRETIGGKSILGNAATKDAFEKTTADFGILHLATHGILDEVNPMNNSLLFSDVTSEDNTKLTLQEIYGLDLYAQLAVLSACNTGNGKYEKGDGIMSLSRAFNYAGVSSTVVSLWQVPDKQTSQLMISFYSYLNEGMTKDKALQKAKLDYLEKSEIKEFKHPFYWAGFVLSGDATPIVSASRFNWIWAIVLIVGLGLLFILLTRFIRTKKSFKL